MLLHDDLASKMERKDVKIETLKTEVSHLIAEVSSLNSFGDLGVVGTSALMEENLRLKDERNLLKAELAMLHSSACGQATSVDPIGKVKAAILQSWVLRLRS